MKYKEPITGNVYVGNDWAFIVTDNEDTLKMKTHNGFSIIPSKVFDAVYKYITSPNIEKILDRLTAVEGSGPTLYWEIDYHSTIIRNLQSRIQFNEFTVENISNSLGALGL